MYKISSHSQISSKFGTHGHTYSTRLYTHLSVVGISLPLILGPSVRREEGLVNIAVIRQY